MIGSGGRHAEALLRARRVLDGIPHRTGRKRRELRMPGVAFAKNEQKTPEYIKINPRGRVPALVIDEGAIVENTAILDFVASKYAPQLMPKDPVQRARAISLMAWFSNNVHPSFTHI